MKYFRVPSISGMALPAFHNGCRWGCGDEEAGQNGGMFGCEWEATVCVSGCNLEE